MTKEAGIVMKFDVVYYLNTGTAQTPVWSLINTGFTTYEGSLNPETEEKQYIGDKQKTTKTKSLSPSYAFQGDAIYGDVVNDYFYDMGRDQEINKTVEIVRVELKNPYLDGKCFAQRGTYGITMDTFDTGVGGETLGYAGTLRQEGDLKAGLFTLTSKTFTEGVE